MMVSGSALYLALLFCLNKKRQKEPFAALQNSGRLLYNKSSIRKRRILSVRYGYFDNKNREYVIDRIDLPVSWTNYIGVGDLYGVFNHTAGGYLLYKSPEYHRITRFRPGTMSISGMRKPGTTGLSPGSRWGSRRSTSHAVMG